MQISTWCIYLVLVINISTFANFSFCNGKLEVLCREGERQALLKLKHDLDDPMNRLANWDTEHDCCRWSGVVCDNITGHVQELHLGYICIEYFYASCIVSIPLGGKISSSLLKLKHLTYLDLSGNDFESTQIPSFIGSLKSLTYLNLSGAGFVGLVPRQLRNLTNLRYLDLELELEVDNLQWMSSFSLLKYLDMTSVDLSMASDWLQAINMLPSLVELRLSSCELDHVSPPPLTNSTSLVILDLSNNKFNSSIFRWLSTLKNLVSLNLEYNSLEGPVPDGIANISRLEFLDLSWNQLEDQIPNILGSKLCKLRKLHLSSNNLTGPISETFHALSLCTAESLEVLFIDYNQLSGSLTNQIGQLKNLVQLNLDHNTISGPIPKSIGRLSHLAELYLSNNQLNGNLPESLGQLGELLSLDLSGNSLNGVVNEVHFSNLTNLKLFLASGNSLTLRTSLNWEPPFQLEKLSLRSWQIKSEMPKWIQRQKHLFYLDMSSSEIKGTIPAWFYNFSSQLNHLDLSNNQIHGECKIAIPPFSEIELSSNQFSGSLPLVHSGINILDFSNNSFSGSVFHFFCSRNIEGLVPDPLASPTLHLRNNLLSGEIPDCLMKWTDLQILNLENNNFSGVIPSSIGYLTDLKSLHFRNNSFSGHLPLSLQNCSSLLTLDLSENNLTGIIPQFISFSSVMMILNLRSNRFYGNIPSDLCNLTNLHILDLAQNNLSGIIPKCLDNLRVMKDPLFFPDFYSFPNVNIPEDAVLVTKGREYQYGSTIIDLVRMIAIDLSDNSLYGKIPKELCSLVGLYTLNLSNNLLTGKIPTEFGGMELLESLDLSRNRLSGQIPESISRLTFLSCFNVSYNNLNGSVPRSTQLQSFDLWSFIGNQLCGPPLLQNCTKNENVTIGVEQSHNGNWIEQYGFYLSLGLGFGFGFWIAMCPLLFNLPWSIVCRQFVDSLALKLYEIIF